MKSGVRIINSLIPENVDLKEIVKKLYPEHFRIINNPIDKTARIGVGLYGGTGSQFIYKKS